MTMVWKSLKNETDMSHASFRGENENLSSSTDVLNKTSNLAMSRCCFADNSKEMDKNEKRTCRACKAIVFSHQICKFVTFSLPSLLSLLKLPIKSNRKIVLNLIAAETLLIPVNIVSFKKAMYKDAFLTVEFHTNLALCNQSKKGCFKIWSEIPVLVCCTVNSAKG